MTWQAALVVCCVLGLLVWACLAVATRRDPRVTAMPDEVEPPQAWPLSEGDDGASGPYLRGGSHAASLSGRR